jgi:hypothetical protein
MTGPRVLLYILFLTSASASIRGVVNKIHRIIGSQVSNRGDWKKSLVVTNSCPMTIHSIVRFFDGSLKHMVIENMPFQEAADTLTDNAVTVALVAAYHTDSSTDIFSSYCSSNDPKYVMKEDGLCYKYYFLNSESSYQIDIVCD